MQNLALLAFVRYIGIDIFEDNSINKITRYVFETIANVILFIDLLFILFLRLHIS